MFSAKGRAPSTGEWTEVASANRGVRGGFRDEVEEVESVELERAGLRLRAAGRRFSSVRARVSRLVRGAEGEFEAYLGEPWLEMYGSDWDVIKTRGDVTEMTFENRI